MATLANHSRRGGSGNNAVLIILSVVGVVAILICLGCGGCFLGVVGLGVMSDGPGFMQEIADDVQRQVQDHPAVQREIGTIESIRTDLYGSIETDEEFNSEDFLAFDVKGSKGKGEIFVESLDEDNGLFYARRILRTANGDFDLGPTPESYQPLPMAEEMDAPLPEVEPETPVDETSAEAGDEAVDASP